MPAEGVEAGAVEWRELDGLAAVFSRVPGEDYDEAPLAKRMGDAPWLAERAGRHDRVLRALLGEVTLLPCRFGTLLRAEARLREMITEHRAEFLESLDRLRGHVEWSVKAFAVEPPEAALEPEDDSGTAFLQSRLRQRREKHDWLATAQDGAGALGGHIAPHVAHTHPLPLTTQPGLVVNLACLVPCGNLPAFQQALDHFAAEAPALTLRANGPWPPYNFAAVPR